MYISKTKTGLLIIGICILVNLSFTSSSSCETSSVDLFKECHPTCTDQVKDKSEYRPPTTCSLRYQDQWSNCFHSINQGRRKTSTDTCVPMVTGVSLTSADDDSGMYAFSMLNIYFTYIPSSDSDIVLVLLRSTNVSDGVHADPYYTIFPGWNRIDVSSDFSKFNQKLKSFHSWFGNLDTCNLYERGNGRFVVEPNVYLLILTVYTPDNIPGPSITYQVTTHNRRFVAESKRIPRESTWKPSVVTAVLPGNRGIHVVFEPLPPSMVQLDTEYHVTMTHWDTWAFIMTQTIKHVEATSRYECIFDFHEEGTFYVLVEPTFCEPCPWVASFEFTIPDKRTTYAAAPKKVILGSKLPSTSIIPIIGMVVGTISVIAVVGFLLHRKIKARIRSRLSSGETSVQDGFEMPTREHPYVCVPNRTENATVNTSGTSSPLERHLLLQEHNSSGIQEQESLERQSLPQYHHVREPSLLEHRAFKLSDFNEPYSSDMDW